MLVDIYMASLSFTLLLDVFEKQIQADSNGLLMFRSKRIWHQHNALIKNNKETPGGSV